MKPARTTAQASKQANKQANAAAPSSTSTLPLERARSHEQVSPGEAHVVDGRVFGLEVSDLLELARVVAGLGVCNKGKAESRT